MNAKATVVVPGSVTDAELDRLAADPNVVVVLDYDSAVAPDLEPIVFDIEDDEGNGATLYADGVLVVSDVDLARDRARGK